MTNKIFIIAEIGINHNGDIKTAKELIETAKQSGCDAVKFQKRDVDTVYSQDLLDSPRESPWGKTQREQKNGLEFGVSEYDEIDSYCKKLKIHWFASAWDSKSVKFLERYDLKYNKIASAMIVDQNLLIEVAKQKKYTFISTGMSSLTDIEVAINIFKKHNCQFELMHCVSTYPMKTEDANLRTIFALKKKFNCPIGYSGHESGLAISYAAASMGISSLERHITLDRTMYGSDQAASIEPNGLRILVQVIRKIEKALGEEKIGYITKEEVGVAKKLRAHIKN
tara:strand:- start:1351 stop:2196 length:846 start_codon:yes stop_codon:yes gene_type:complete